MATTMLAAGIALSHGCRLDEGDAHPCIIFGSDWGDTLYAMGIAFWFELVTIWLIPAGVIVFVIGIVRIRRWRREV